MKAWRVHEFGSFREQLTFAQDVEDPKAPSAGVVIRVRAAALNFPDLLAIAGKYQMKAPLPFTPGLEAAGEVIEAGPQSRFKVGDRVMTVALWGAFAQKIAAVDAACFPVPDGMTDAQAASFMITHQTSYFGLVHRTALREGETLLVHGGAGGVGTTAIQIGKALGATVIATAGSEEKLEICRQCGADHVINYRTDDFVPHVRKITKNRGADVIYDPVGGDVFDRSTKVVAFGGRLLVIGFASGRIPEIKANRILLKNMSVVGLVWGNYQFQRPEMIGPAHQALTELFEQGKIKPVICAELPLEELPEGLAMLEERRSHGKVVLKVD